MGKPVYCDEGVSTPIIPQHCPEGYWLVQVNSLSEVTKPTRDHAYQLPNNSVWILSYDNNTFVEIVPSGGGANEPTQIRNTDNYLVVSGSGTYSVTININETGIRQLAGDVTARSLEGYVFNPVYNSVANTLTLSVNNSPNIVVPLGSDTSGVELIQYDPRTSFMTVQYFGGASAFFPLTEDDSQIASKDWVESRLRNNANSIRFSASVVSVTGSTYLADGLHLAIDSPVFGSASASNVMLQFYTENETIMNLGINSTEWTNSVMLGDVRFIKLTPAQATLVQSITYPIFTFASVRESASSPFMEFKSLVRMGVPDGNGVTY